jgi:molybdenum cofactor guanylyltransferase
METALLKKLFDHYYTDPPSGAYLFTNDLEPEPLCAIYKSASLETIYQMYMANALPRQSMKYAIEQMKVSKYPITENQKIFFSNYNSHAEINGL